MPPRDASKVQLDFPLLVADLIRQLNLTGALGVLDFSPAVIPTFLIGSREGALTITSEPVAFQGGEIFEDRTTNPGLNAVLATTGQLPAGTYDVIAGISIAGHPAGADFTLFQHRDAADAGTLATWPFARGVPDIPQGFPLTMAYTIATNERFRWLNIGAVIGGVQFATYIMARRRPSP